MNQVAYILNQVFESSDQSNHSTLETLAKIETKVDNGMGSRKGLDGRTEERYQRKFDWKNKLTIGYGSYEKKIYIFYNAKYILKPSPMRIVYFSTKILQVTWFKIVQHVTRTRVTSEIRAVLWHTCCHKSNSPDPPFHSAPAVTNLQYPTGLPVFSTIIGFYIHFTSIVKKI